MHDLIVRCLSLTPSHRPGWEEINLKELDVGVVVEDVEEYQPEREIIRLGTGKESS